MMGKKVTWAQQLYNQCHASFGKKKSLVLIKSKFEGKPWRQREKFIQFPEIFIGNKRIIWCYQGSNSSRIKGLSKWEIG